MPTKKELESLIDFANVSPAMDGAVFTTDSYLFGTSTVVSGSGGSHWGVDFTDGRTVTIGQATCLYVRCVI